MTTPQLENGYVRIATETMKELAKIRISGQAYQVLNFIFLKTYGWQKKEDKISLSQFVSGTNLSKVAVCKALNKLSEMNIIIRKWGSTKKGNKTPSIYRFQKNYRTWKALPKKVTLPKKVKGSTKKGNRVVPIMVHTKDTITKDTITKDTIPPYIPPQLWKEFIIHRKMLRKPLTEKAKSLVINKIKKLKEKGNNPVELLEAAIEKGWLTVYPPKNGNKPQPKTFQQIARERTAKTLSNWQPKGAQK